MRRRIKIAANAPIQNWVFTFVDFSYIINVQQRKKELHHEAQLQTDDTCGLCVLSYLCFLAGIAWATINVNSFHMVVELATGNDTGKYTSYYYTASMAAQIITPILSEYLMQAFNSMNILFPYGTIFVALSFVTMLFVKHGDSKPTDLTEAVPDAE